VNKTVNNKSIFLYGLAGAGKNFIGFLLEQHFGFYYWDADEALTLQMREYIASKKIFTEAMRDELTQQIIKKIRQLRQQYPQLVVSQALYKNKNRLMILAAFPDMKLVEVKADLNIINKRLQQRSGNVGESYAEQIKSGFEATDIPHEILINNSDKENIEQQLKLLLARL
jgi:gluconate kinase